jgi:hypothetical protein
LATFGFHFEEPNTSTNLESDAPEEDPKFVAERICLAYYFRATFAYELGVDIGDFAHGAATGWDGPCASPAAGTS